MSGLHDVLRHLVVSGPARNDEERERLLAEIDQDEQPRKSSKEEKKP